MNRNIFKHLVLKFIISFVFILFINLLILTICVLTINNNHSVSKQIDYITKHISVTESDITIDKQIKKLLK